MAYNGKTNWQLNEIVKPEDMNRIEQGVIDAHENLLIHKTDPNSHTDIRNKFNEFVKGVTGSNATLTITKGNGTTSTVTVNNVANATKATQDSTGQQINSTYIKGLSVSGKTITYTKGNNTTGTITTQDTVYTHPNSGVRAGTYKSVTVNAQGHVTGGSNPTTLAGYGITDGVFKYALGSTADKSVYTMFASCQADAGSGNISATVLLTQCGNFGGAYQGAWLIQVSTRGGKYMSVKTLRSASSSPTFGYYVSGSTCYFGALFPVYRGDCNVTVLSSTGCTLKDFGDTTTAPSGWTAVTPELMLDSGNYNSYAPTKTGGGASGTWGINITGNAASATKLQTPRAISLTGNASGSANFDGSGNVSINTTVSKASVADVVHKAIQPRGVSGCNNYIFYGTLTIPQSGDFFKLEVLGGCGYNSNISQSREGTLYFRTGNNSPAHYAAYSEYHRNGAGRLEFFIVKDSGTKYRIYSGLTSFTGTMQVIPYVGQNSSFDLALNIVSALPNGAVEVEQQQLIYASTVNNYAPTKTGGGASGTWGINISGNADNATKWNGLVNDLSTENNTDTCIPVLKDNKLQHTTKQNMTVGNAVNDGNGANIANTYLKKSGGTMSGPLNFANGTWNRVGDDSYMGDHNIGGTFCIKGANNTTGIALVNVNNERDYAHISYGGGNINFNKKIGGNLAGKADSATNDSAGQQINTTYIKGLSISGNTITYTKGNGGTGSITVPTGAGAKGYIVESKYNADGSWYRKWSDGWLEQGGVAAKGYYSTITFLKPFTTTKYYANAMSNGYHGEAQLNNQIWNKTTTGMYLYINVLAVDGVWYACGK